MAEYGEELMTIPETLTRAEAAELLGVTTRQIDRYLVAGKLERVPGVLPGARVRIYRSSVDRFLPTHP